MNKFQKLGVFCFRLVGILQILFGIISAFYVSSQAAGTQIIAFILGILIFSLVFAIPGVVLILLSKKLGSFAGKGLDD